MIVRGWFDFAFIYKGLLLTFLNGKYFPVNRLNITSKKSVSMRFVSIVIERPSLLNIEMISFFILSSTGPIPLLTVARPSSLYRPKFSFSNNGDKFSSRYIPTISQISVLTKLSIVKSNDGFSPLLTQVPSLLNNSHFWASLIASITLSSLVIMVLA